MEHRSISLVLLGPVNPGLKILQGPIDEGDCSCFCDHPTIPASASLLALCKLAMPLFIIVGSSTFPDSIS